MLAGVPQWIVDAGTVAGALTAVVLFLMLRPVKRCVRWLFQRNIGQPLRSSFRHEVTEVVTKVVPLIVREQVKAEVAPLRDELRSHMQDETVAGRRITDLLEDHGDRLSRLEQWREDLDGPSSH